MLRFEQACEPARVQTLGPEGSVERFHESVVRRLAGTREVDLDPVLISPEIHSLAGELAAIVTEQKPRYSAFLLQPVQGSYHIFSLQALPRFDGYALSSTHIDDGQRTEPFPVLQLIGYEV